MSPAQQEDIRGFPALQCRLEGCQDVLADSNRSVVALPPRSTLPAGRHHYPAVFDLNILNLKPAGLREPRPG